MGHLAKAIPDRSPRYMNRRTLTGRWKTSKQHWAIGMKPLHPMAGAGHPSPR